MVEGRNELSKPDAEEIVEMLSQPQKVDDSYLPFGDGHAAEKIVNAIENCTKDRDFKKDYSLIIKFCKYGN